MERIAVFGAADGSGAIGRPAVVAMDDQGRILIVSEEKQHEIDVFESSGRYLRTIGRRGPGPGEFQAISAILPGGGDTINVIDARNQAWTKMLSDGRVLSTDWFSAAPFSAAVLETGSFVFGAHVPRPESIGYPLHVTSGPGAPLQSFGAERPVFREDMFYSFQRYVGSASPGGVWAAHHLQYVIELWGSDRVHRTTLVRSAEWFPPKLRQRNLAPGTPQFPAIIGIREDSERRLWVLIRVNEAGFERGLGRPAHSIDGMYYPLEDIDRIFGTRIEVIDSEAGVLVAEGQTDETLIGFVGPRHVVSYSERDNPRVTLWRIGINHSRR